METQEHRKKTVGCRKEGDHEIIVWQAICVSQPKVVHSGIGSDEEMDETVGEEWRLRGLKASHF
jgi:hypothetical protein